MLMRLACLFSVWAFATAVQAADLVLPPSARLVVERLSALDSVAVPVGPFDGARVPMMVPEGKVTRQAWRIDAAALTPLQITAPLRAQLISEGYDVVLDCAQTECGGFDFRFAVEVLPGPNMYVNVSAYRFLSAVLGPRDSPRAVVSLIVSSSASSRYIQIFRVERAVLPGLPVAAVPNDDPVPDALPDLLADGHVILTDLTFATGTSDLSVGPFASLQALAKILSDDPAIRIVLVGHSDAIGGLEPNMVVSRQRAQAVLQRLVQEYGIAESRIDAEGVGYLSPVAQNSTKAGRRSNRRVEAVLLPTP